MNFQPRVLHDTRFIGDTFRDRGASVQKRRRWSERFGGMEKPHQQAVLTELVSVFMSDLPEAEREQMANILLNGARP